MGVGFMGRGIPLACALLITACGGGGEGEGDSASPTSVEDFATSGTAATTEVPTTTAETSTTASLSTTASPTTTAEPMTTAEPTTTANGTDVLAEPPTIDPDLAAHVPRVEGFTTVAELPAPELWEFYNLPDGVSAYAASIQDAQGRQVGRLIVATDADGDPPLDAFVDRVFADAVSFVTARTELEDGSAWLATNVDSPSWVGIADGAVVEAVLPDADTGQWAWGADGLLWVVRGELAAEAYVEALLTEQVAALDPYDLQGMTGDLWDHTPGVDGYIYLDFPRADTLAALDELPLQGCNEHVYLGYLRDEEAEVSPMEPDDLQVAIFEIAESCQDDGEPVDLDATLEADFGLVEEQLADTTVHRDANNVVYVVGDVVVWLASQDPATFERLGDVVASILQGQPA